MTGDEHRAFPAAPGSLLERFFRNLWLPRSVFLLLFLAAGAWLASVDYRKVISTDVMDLLPPGDQQPELSMIRSLAAERQGRVVLLRLSRVTSSEEASSEPDLAGAEAMAVDVLRASGAFEEVLGLGAGAGDRSLGLLLFNKRFDLLLPSWLAAHSRQAAESAEQWRRRLAGLAVSELETFLEGDTALAMQDLVPSDPLLLVPSLVGALQEGDAGLLPASKPGLIWALQRGNPLSEEGQNGVFGALEALSLRLREAAPGVELHWTGVARFARQSKACIQGEITWLNIVSLGVVSLVCVLLVSRPRRVWHLVPPVLAGMAGGWVGVTLAFERVHALVFVIGALLAGAAVDYGVHLFLHAPVHPAESYAAKLRRLLRPLLASVLTTVAGFLFLLLSELPLLRQLGVYVAAGLVSALAGAILWFGQVRAHYLASRPFLERKVLVSLRVRNGVYGLALLCCGLAVFGISRLQWLDDIRELEPPAPELKANDLALRRAFGEEPSGAHSLWLTKGDSLALARDAWGRFSMWTLEGGAQAKFTSLALLLPSRADWDMARSARPDLAGFSDVFLAELGGRGFEPASFAPFVNAWQAWLKDEPPAYETLCAGAFTELKGPLSLLFSVRPGASFLGILATGPVQGVPPREANTFAVAQLATLNGAFSEYRRSALQLSLLGLSLLGVGVSIVYGVRRGLAIFALPLAAVALSFGLLGFLGGELNLFHLLGAFLGVCLSHDYAIFVSEEAAGVPASVRLSALSTLASFGVLAFSKIPVVAALGLSVSLIVGMALLLVELASLFRTQAPAS